MLQLTIDGLLASEKFNHNYQQYSQLKDSASLHVQCRVPKIAVFPGVGSVTRVATKAAHPYPEAQSWWGLAQAQGFFKCAKTLPHSSVRSTVHYAQGLGSDGQKGKL